MKEYLLDLVQHTHDLGCIQLVKIMGSEESTEIVGLAEDRSLVIQGKYKQAIPELVGTFGMPTLGNLKTLLGLDAYREDAEISINRQVRNGVEEPVGLHFQTKNRDFQNDYRFMASEIVNDKLKPFKYNTPKWSVTFAPTIFGIQRLKMQAQANNTEITFQAKTDGGNLKFYFGDASTHAGEFIFEPNVDGDLTHVWSWPISHVIKILDLPGDKVMQISNDGGATQIIVDSGLAEYTYILPAQSK